MTNHVIDPTFFYDAIDEFAFDYDLYSKTDESIDEYGKMVFTYTHYTISGSLQSGGARKNQNKAGNTLSHEYNFYCKSLYRINIDDIIAYNNNYYIVTGLTNDFDEWGVRACTVSLISLTEYRDLADYINYLNGTKIV